jgi:hypothetical protein
MNDRSASFQETRILRMQNRWLQSQRLLQHTNYGTTGRSRFRPHPFHETRDRLWIQRCLAIAQLDRGPQARYLFGLSAEAGEGNAKRSSCRCRGVRVCQLAPSLNDLHRFRRSVFNDPAEWLRRFPRKSPDVTFFQTTRPCRPRASRSWSSIASDG